MLLLLFPTTSSSSFVLVVDLFDDTVDRIRNGIRIGIRMHAHLSRVISLLYHLYMQKLTRGANLIPTYQHHQYLFLFPYSLDNMSVRTTVQPLYTQSFTRSEQKVSTKQQLYFFCSFNCWLVDRHIRTHMMSMPQPGVDQPVMIYNTFTSWHDTDFWWKCRTNSHKVADNIIVSAWAWLSEVDQWNQWWYIIIEQKITFT